MYNIICAIVSIKQTKIEIQLETATEAENWSQDYDLFSK